MPSQEPRDTQRLGLDTFVSASPLTFNDIQCRTIYYWPYCPRHPHLLGVYPGLSPGPPFSPVLGYDVYVSTTTSIVIDGFDSSILSLV